MTNPVKMAEVYRGAFLESEHYGHAVISDASGNIIEAWGNPDGVVLPRSSAKMIQALPLLESGVGKSLSSQQLALACASHNAERQHLRLVNSWLSELSADDSALVCGPQKSRDPEVEAEMIKNGTPIPRACNNCSGKHTGFLMLAQSDGNRLDYSDPDHFVQRNVRSAFEELTGEDSPGFGIDGCSAPNFAARLSGVARAMGKFAGSSSRSDARSKAQHRLTEAMMLHPELVAGKGRACTQLMQATSEPVAVKTGAEGFFVAILPKRELGIALKIVDGATRAAELAITALLVRLGAADPNHPVIAAYLNQEIRNWDGIVTGYQQPVKELWQTKRP